MPLASSGYDAAKTVSKSGWEGLRGFSVAVVGALAAWGLTDEGTQFLSTTVPVQYLVFLPAAQAALRAVVDYAKHRNTPVKVDAQSIRDARDSFTR